MAYCRFGNADIYLFFHVNGNYCCMCCRLAPKVKTIFTEGLEHDKLFWKIEPCEKCHGEGCDECMMHGDTMMKTPEEVLAHIKLHRENGDFVPENVDEAIRAEIEEQE